MKGEGPIRASASGSPCVRNCCLDDDDVCLGCGRAIEEIINWSRASDSERALILARAQERLALRTRLDP